MEEAMIVQGRYRFTYPLDLLDKPILYTLIRRFDILANIRRANVTGQEGWLIVDMEGEEKEVAAGIAWAKEQGVDIAPVNEPGQGG
jgi:ABC-type methionine transport system ATPase subunit